jgi:MbtH-like protein
LRNGVGQAAQCSPAAVHGRPQIEAACGLAQGLQRSRLMHDEQDDIAVYKVVLNHEEQYSIWPAERDNAPG